jgi:hypothetical protein
MVFTYVNMFSTIIRKFSFINLSVLGEKNKIRRKRHLIVWVSKCSRPQHISRPKNKDAALAWACLLRPKSKTTQDMDA